MLLLPSTQPSLLKETDNISPCQGTIQGLELLFGIPGVRQLAMCGSGGGGGGSHVLDLLILTKVFGVGSFYMCSADLDRRM